MEAAEEPYLEPKPEGVAEYSLKSTRSKKNYGQESHDILQMLHGSFNEVALPVSKFPSSSCRTFTRHHEGKIATAS